jgi:hypothetical protein
LGVIDDENQAILTKFSVAFQYYLPYLTPDGQSTSISIATGPQVSVNSIIGLPFITATGMITDTVDNVVKAKHLVCEPFPIEFVVQQNMYLPFPITVPPFATMNSGRSYPSLKKPMPLLQKCMQGLRWLPIKRLHF